MLLEVIFRLPRDRRRWNRLHAHKIFEDDYIDYFEEARKESRISKYSPTKVYTQRRVKEILEISRKFIEKLLIILEG